MAGQPHGMWRLLELRNSCDTLTHPTAKKIGHPSSIKGEDYETTTMYYEFAEQAEKAGDHAVALQFQEIRQYEMKYRDAFSAELTKLEAAKKK